MDSKTTFEEELIRKGSIMYPNVGNSMMPLIRQGRDILIIKRPKEWNRDCGNTTIKLRRLDVPLYKRSNGVYVLHRILKVRSNDYVICGDNRYHKEYGITDKNIIGVMTGIVRDGKEISVRDMKYRIYSHIWCDLFIVRVIVLKAKRVFKRLKKHIRK